MFTRPVTELSTPLLRTKISVPRLPGEFVHRSRLTERIHQGVKGSLTLLAAPAGFGKTNLLIEWAKETTLPVAWLTIDSDDNDLSRFIRYCRPHQTLAFILQMAELSNFGNPHIGIANDIRGIGKAVVLNVSGSLDALADGRA
jgi:hypothetical protein